MPNEIKLLLTIATENKWTNKNPHKKTLKIEVWASGKNINCVNPWKDETKEECNLDRLYPTQDILKSKDIDI